MARRTDTVLPSPIFVQIILVTPDVPTAAAIVADGMTTTSKTADPAKTIGATRGQASTPSTIVGPAGAPAAVGKSALSSIELAPGNITNAVTASLNARPESGEADPATFGSFLAKTGTGSPGGKLVSAAGGGAVPATATAPQAGAATAGEPSSSFETTDQDAGSSAKAGELLALATLGTRSTPAASQPVGPILPAPGPAAISPTALPTPLEPSAAEGSDEAVQPGKAASANFVHASVGTAGSLPTEFHSGSSIAPGRNGATLPCDPSAGPPPANSDPRQVTATALPVGGDTGRIDTILTGSSGSPDQLPRFSGIPDQLAPQIMLAMAGRRQTVSVQLHPMELGVVQIRISVDHDRKVKAVLSSAQPETMDLLQRHAHHLQRTLTDAGLALAASDALTFDLDLSEQGAGRREQEPSGGADSFGQSPQPSAATERPTPGIRHYAGTGLLDLVL